MQENNSVYAEPAVTQLKSVHPKLCRLYSQIRGEVGEGDQSTAGTKLVPKCFP